jgi:hypothetical protein
MAMKMARFITFLGGILIFSAGAFGQETIPGGTILPVRLESSLSGKAEPESEITGRIMQEVPLPNGRKLSEGAKVIGRMVRVAPASNGKGVQISFRFDQLVVSKRRIPITTNLRAIASLREIEDAQIPLMGADRGTSQDAWTTIQIGGDVVYRGGGKVMEEGKVVGEPVSDGVLSRLSSEVGAPCRDEVEGNNRRQALWVFSADACGVYGLAGVTILHAGRSSPVGEITLASKRSNLKVRSGSGMLLRVIDG